VKVRLRSLSLFIASCLLLTISGCGYSLHTRSSLPFQSIQIVRIENKTVEPKLQDRLYNALTEEFLKEGIAVSPQAGYKLSCIIDHFELKLLAEQSNVATDYEVIIKGNFVLTDPSGKKKEFKDIGAPFIVSFAGAGPLDELLASKEVASDRAIKDMATEIVGLLIYR
jgi:hypothetical protein